MLQSLLNCFLVFSLLFIPSMALSSDAKGVCFDFIEQYDDKTLTCLKEKNLTQNLIVGIETVKGWDYIYTDYLKHLNSFGMNITLLIMPCRVRDPVLSIRELLQKIPKQLVNGISIWATPFSASSKCSWEQTKKANNCEHLNQLIQQIKRNNVSATITSENQEWQYVFGDYCQFLGPDIPLIWIPEDPDFIPSFDNFKSFGGWKTPIKKVFATELVCGQQLYEAYWK